MSSSISSSTNNNPLVFSIARPTTPVNPPNAALVSQAAFAALEDSQAVFTALEELEKEKIKILTSHPGLHVEFIARGYMSSLDLEEIEFERHFANNDLQSARNLISGKKELHFRLALKALQQQKKYLAFLLENEKINISSEIIKKVSRENWNAFFEQNISLANIEINNTPFIIYALREKSSFLFENLARDKKNYLLLLTQDQTDYNNELYSYYHVDTPQEVSENLKKLAISQFLFYECIQLHKAIKEKDLSLITSLVNQHKELYTTIINEKNPITGVSPLTFLTAQLPSALRTYPQKKLPNSFLMCKKLLEIGAKPDGDSWRNAINNEKFLVIFFINNGFLPQTQVYFIMLLNKTKPSSFTNSLHDALNSYRYPLEKGQIAEILHKNSNLFESRQNLNAFINNLIKAFPADDYFNDVSQNQLVAEYLIQNAIPNDFTFNKDFPVCVYANLLNTCTRTDSLIYVEKISSSNPDFLTTLYTYLLEEEKLYPTLLEKIPFSPDASENEMNAAILYFKKVLTSQNDIKQRLYRIVNSWPDTWKTKCLPECTVLYCIENSECKLDAINHLLQWPRLFKNNPVSDEEKAKIEQHFIACAKDSMPRLYPLHFEAAIEKFQRIAGFSDDTITTLLEISAVSRCYYSLPYALFKAGHTKNCSFHDIAYSMVDTSIEIALRNNVTLDAKDKENELLFHALIRQRRFRLVTENLPEGFDVSQQGPDEKTALQLLALSDYKDRADPWADPWAKCVTALINKGASITNELTAIEKKALLDKVIGIGGDFQQFIFSKMLSSLPINAEDKNVIFALFKGATVDTIQNINKAILQYEAVVHLSDNEIFEIAEAIKSRENALAQLTLKELLTAGRFCRLYSFGDLIRCAETVTAVLKTSLSLATKDKNNWTLIHFLTKYGFTIPIIDHFPDGLETDSKSPDGKTLLQHLVSQNTWSIHWMMAIQKLVFRGASLTNELNENEKFELLLIALKNDVDFFDWLLSQNISISSVGHLWKSNLLSHIMCCLKEKTALLLEKKIPLFLENAAILGNRLFMERGFLAKIPGEDLQFALQIYDDYWDFSLLQDINSATIVSHILVGYQALPPYRFSKESVTTARKTLPNCPLDVFLRQIPLSHNHYTFQPRRKNVDISETHLDHIKTLFNGKNYPEIDRILRDIKNKRPQTGTPVAHDSNKLNIFYKNLEEQMKLFIKLLKTSGDPLLIERYITELNNSGKLCPIAWVGVLDQAVPTLQNDNIPVNLQENAYLKLWDFRQAAAEVCLIVMGHKDTPGYEVHNALHVKKVLEQQNRGVQGSAVVENDHLIDEQLKDMPTIVRTFDRIYNAATITRFMSPWINAECLKDGSPMLQWVIENKFPAWRSSEYVETHKMLLGEIALDEAKIKDEIGRKGFSEQSWSQAGQSAIDEEYREFVWDMHKNCIKLAAVIHFLQTIGIFEANTISSSIIESFFSYNDVSDIPTPAYSGLNDEVSAFFKSFNYPEGKIFANYVLSKFPENANENPEVFRAGVEEQSPLTTDLDQWSFLQD